MTGGEWERYPLLDALIERRSRRFAAGLTLPGGPLAHASRVDPVPLTVEEEAALAFAACGLTGPVLLELPFAGDAGEAGGNIITHVVGRTVASGDAMHTVAALVVNDGGVWLLKRPQDVPRAEVGALAAMAREGRFVELYERSRVRLAESRPEVKRAFPAMPSFNRWSAQRPGTTCFLPVNELSALYINVLLSAFDEAHGAYILDERNGFRPAGLAGFARSRGGHLEDDPRAGRVGTVGITETWLSEFTAIEQGGMLQNLGLMTQALGLGGFPYFAAHAYAEFETYGFRIERVPFARTIGAPGYAALLLRLLGRNLPVPTPVGLERGGEVLLRSFCPPYFSNMAAAVRAFVDYKFAPRTGTLRDGDTADAWLDGAGVRAGIPPPSERAIDATIAYCEYVYRRYGRFPATTAPLRTVLAYQAHHLDPAFYERFYAPGALSTTQRAHPLGPH
jgi:hypothetical protein